MGGSPKAAFCSAPAVTGRWAWPATDVGRSEISAWQRLVISGESSRAAIVTGPVASGVGVRPPKSPKARTLSPSTTNARGAATRVATRAALRWTGSVATPRLQVHDRAGHGARDARHELDAPDHDAGELVHVGAFGQHHDLVRAGDHVDLDHARDVADGARHVARPTHLSLDQDVCLDHVGH